MFATVHPLQYCVQVAVPNSDPTESLRSLKPKKFAPTQAGKTLSDART